MAVLQYHLVDDSKEISSTTSSSTYSRRGRTPSPRQKLLIDIEGDEEKDKTSDEMSERDTEPLHHCNDIMPQKYRDGKVKVCPLLSILMFWCSSYMLRYGKQLVFSDRVQTNLKSKEIII